MPAVRPEFENPPEVFYSSTEARRYTVNTRIRKIQRDMTLRALELLNLPKPTGATRTSEDGEPVLQNASALILDVGCGSGLSGDVLTEQGHAWFGVDISADMIRIAKDTELESYFAEESDEDEEGRFDRRKVKWGQITPSDEDVAQETNSDADGDEDSEAGQAALPPAPVRPVAPNIVEVTLNDIGQGVPFRPGTFDGCVSISVIQWLCHSSKKGEVPQRRLMAFFQGLYNSLRRGAKAVLQFYPSEPQQIHMITRAAMKCGFSGGVVVDYPHSTRAKKHYLVLQAGQVLGGFVPPPALGVDVSDEDEDDEGDEEEDGEYEGSDEDAEEDEYEDAAPGRKRARVAGRDRERVKRVRSHSAHEKKRRRKDNRPVTGTKEWALLKKEERRRRGDKVTDDTKYSLRRRKPRF